MKKITITQKQAIQFNEMLKALTTIHKGYMTPKKLRKEADPEYGLEYEEVIEMAYENIQELARVSSKGVRTIPISEPPRPIDHGPHTTVVSGDPF